jgi:hypothetical protein
MPNPGPPPKANPRHRHPTLEWTDIPNRPYAGPSPDLPALKEGTWDQMVVSWWEWVRHMPHCVQWTDGDWKYAVETAYLKNQFWQDYWSDQGYTTNNAVEIRQRESQMGTNSDALRKLRIRYVDPKGVPSNTEDEQTPGEEIAKGGAITPLATRRLRLTG